MALRIVPRMVRRGGPAVGRSKKGGCGGHYRPSGPSEGAVDTVGRYGGGAGDGDDSARRGTDERWRVGLGRTWERRWRGCGCACGAVGLFVCVHVLGWFCGRDVVATFGLVDARLRAKRE
jgi:hypothetical protein